MLRTTRLYTARFAWPAVRRRSQAGFEQDFPSRGQRRGDILR